MSHLNKPNVEETFKICKQYIKSAVPPCVVEIDTPTHFEVVAINGDQKHLFANIVSHDHVVTLGFDTTIPEEDLKQLLSDRLIKHLNEHRRMAIHNLEYDDYRQDFQDACNKLLYYFDQQGWTAIP